MSQYHEPFDPGALDPREPGLEPDTLVIADQSLRLGFIQLPKVILYARNISRDAKLLYAVLLGYAWQELRCFPGYARLCQDMGASENAVRKYMRELEAAGLLHQRRRGLGRTNIYTLADLRTAKIEVQEPQMSRTAKIEVQDPAKTAAPEPTKSEGEIETEEIEAGEIETDKYSNAARKNALHKQLSTFESKQIVRKRIKSTDGSTPVAAAGIPDRSAAPAGFAPVGQLLTERYPLRAAPTGNGAAPGRGRPPKVSEKVAVLIEELTHKLHDDPDNVRSNITRAARLRKASGLSDDAFYHRLHEAKSITQQQGSVKKPAADGHGVLNRMPYFFAVVEDLVGLKQHGAQ